MQPTTIIIDVDGVLTDGKVYYSESGERSKGFCSRDTEAIRDLIANGWTVYLLTSSSWPGMPHYARRTGAIAVVARDKAEWIAENIKGTFIGIGDSPLDIPFLTMAEKAFCPADAHPNVKKIKEISVLACKGGEGVVSELAARLWFSKTTVNNY